MKRTLVKLSLFIAAMAMIVPLGASAGEKHGRYISGASEAADYNGDAKGIERFRISEANKNLIKVVGDITAVSSTSITIMTPDDDDDDDVNASHYDGSIRDRSSDESKKLVKFNSDSSIPANTSYTFIINSDTKVVRRFRGLSSVSELSVGDEVKVWVTSLTSGTAKLIQDKSIWWLRLGGKVSEGNATTGTFRLLLPMRKNGKLKTFSGVVKTSSATVYIKADGSAGSFADIDNNDTIRVRGVWNNEGYYLNARKIWFVE